MLLSGIADSSRDAHTQMAAFLSRASSDVVAVSMVYRKASSTSDIDAVLQSSFSALLCHPFVLVLSPFFSAFRMIRPSFLRYHWKPRRLQQSIHS